MKQVSGSHKKPDLPSPRHDVLESVLRKSPQLRHSMNVPSTALAGVKFPCP